MSPPHSRGPPIPRRKYNNKKTVIDGITFDSRGEAEYWLILKDGQTRGKLSGLIRGRPYKIYIGQYHVCTYIPDYEFTGPNGGWVVMDYKGFRTPIYNLKKKLMKAVYGIEITEIGPAVQKDLKKAKRRKK